MRAHETSYTLAFGESDTCSGKATVALKAPSTGNGPDSDYTVTGVAAGQCDITFTDFFGQSTQTHVVVTTSGFIISGKKHR